MDADRLAAIGYCFRGQCVLDLARAGAALRGVASFHSTLAPPDPARWPASKDPILPKVLAFHGWDDPFVPSDPNIVAFATEMTEREADWQCIAYGNTQHSFTNPGIHLPEMGAIYNKKAARRSWQALESFLSEIWNQTLSRKVMLCPH